MPGPDDLGLLWGKARGTSGSYHPLLCHLIDVAVVAEAMWKAVLPPAARQRLSTVLGVSEAAAGVWIAFWAGLHDLGKCSPIFQQQSKVDWQRLCVGWGLGGEPLLVRAPHGIVTALTLPDLLTSGYGLAGPLARRVGTLLGGHHGVFPLSADLLRIDQQRRAVGRGRWERARAALVAELAQVLDLPAREPPTTLDNASALFLAGLVSVADWIGSNAEYFPYAASPINCATSFETGEYSRRATAQARQALDALGWTGWTPPTEARSFEVLFPRFRPNALQRAVVELAERLSGPSLAIVEAPMGEGKTEAAMYLADRWAVAGQRGCYFALPTQATTNQMFGRVRDFLAERYPSALVNLQLLHGQAALSAEFELLRQQGRRPFESSGVEDDAEPGTLPSVVASEWFTYRKRGLLAPFGVGTIDQGLLAALQTRHVFVRLFGLAHKTVIVDEVHAYDTYMTALLERLLEWLAALGSSVVLLSATLPDSRRQALAAAFARGLPKPTAAPAALPAKPYPRLTWVDANGSDAVAIPRPPAPSKEVELVWVRSAEPVELVELLRRALVAGGCAAVICNTVRRAQEVYQALRTHFSGRADDGEPLLDLFHSRYLFEDRDAREKRALLRFGKPGGRVRFGPVDEREVRRPTRAVLVATQVIEQSLDLDFDLMVTDLAPTDLVLQRLGRLHRHTRLRPAALEFPRLWIRAPEVINGAPRFDRGSEAVYAGHILLRSWLALSGRSKIMIPDDLASLVEATYDERSCPAELPPALHERWATSLAELQATQANDQAEAAERWLKPVGFGGALAEIMGTPRAEDAPDIHQAHQALTRLSEPTVAVVALYGSAERPTLDPAGGGPVTLHTPPNLDQARRLLRRSVALGDRRVVFTLLAQEPPAGWKRSPLLRQHRPLVFDAQGQAVVGRYQVRLDVELGVVVAE